LERAAQRLLSRDEEIALAKRIEEASRLLVEAVVRSPMAVVVLIAVLEELEEGTPAVDEVTLATMDDSTIRKAGVEALLGPARRLRALFARRGTDDGAELEAARTDLVDAALEHGVSTEAVDRLLAKLVDARRTRQGVAGRGLDSTIRTIRDSRRTSERAKAAFVEANIGLVASMARRRAQGGLSLPDLIQEGSMGLMRAVEKFDHRRGVRFSTYAAWWIRHSLNRALSDQSRTIRLPVHLFGIRQRVARIARDFWQESGREPTAAELSQLAGVSEDKIRDVTSLPLEPVSLETPFSPDNDTRLGELIADPVGTSILDELSLKHVRHRLQRLLGTLGPREREILRLRFGIDGSEPLTLQEIAQSFSLSRERIRQIEVEALAKLRGRAAAEDLDSHLAS
jgi:RNA polymerase primary sigma factor